MTPKTCRQLPVRIAGAAALLGLLLQACCSRSTRLDPLEPPDPREAVVEAAPADFALEVTVLGSARALSDPGTPRFLRPAHYIVEADRTLRASIGRRGRQDYPGITRRLEPADIGRLWWDLRASGLARQDHPGIVGSAADRPPGDRPMYLFFISSGGDRRLLLIDPVSGPEAPEARRIVDYLAELAWVG